MYKPKHAKKKDLEAYLKRYEKNKIKDKIKNVNCISKNEHDLIIDNLVTSNNVKFNLFEYLCSNEFVSSSL